MLDYLRDGLTDFDFVIVTPYTMTHQNMAAFELKVNLPIYQEAEPSSSIWAALEGGKDDVFIYDRCGRLTYYIPFPLSIIHPQQPIIQAALLSTYFDNPCGESCPYGADVTNSTPSLDPLTQLDVDLEAHMIQQDQYRLPYFFMYHISN